MSPALGDLRVLRKAIGVSQSRLAAMLGVSTRAVQSYEQGWRRTPTLVQKLAGFLCAEQWRSRNPDAQPCWELMRCPDANRRACPTYQFDASHCCWLMHSNCLDTPPGTPWASRLAKCTKCPAGARVIRA